MADWQTYRNGNPRQLWDLERRRDIAPQSSAIGSTDHVAAKVSTTLASSC